MRKLLYSLRHHKLLAFGLLIHFCFYLSAAWFGWFDIFFSSPALHNGFKGIDFYQIVRGAWAWWHGGSLTGAPLPDSAVYAPLKYYINRNVYHPLFSLELGSFLMQFPAEVSYWVWFWMKFVFDLLIIDFFWRFARQYKYGELATFVLLTNFSEYLELAAGQFHSVFNACLLLFLLLLSKKSTWWPIVYYAGGLLVKPVGLLFLPVLILKKQWFTALLAVSLFVGVTWFFMLNHSGNYYFDNLTKQLFHPETPGPDQIFTLNAFLKYTFPWPTLARQILQYAILGLILAASALKRVSIYKSIFLMIVYFLLFYNLVYEYDWSSLAYVLPVCLLFCQEFQTKLARICILLTCLPSCFLVLNMFHVDILWKVWGNYAGVLAWHWMVASKVVPLLLLCGCVLASDLRAIIRWAYIVCKAFFARRKGGSRSAMMNENGGKEESSTSSGDNRKAGFAARV